jgi:hypothetical protein
LDEPTHLLSLIQQVKPRAALFTTYTFSVSHFDAVFIPVLRAVGCQDIAVLVDADEAAAGSEEPRSRAAGRIYWLAPVHAPGGGVFHPKMAYLAGEDDDVLAVGSGNLTASGQSLQLESFDAVGAKEAPTVFRELADWMQLLASQTERKSLQASRLLAQAAPRARQAYRLNAGKAPTSKLPPPSLVHTLTATARESLEAIFITEADFAEEVTVLSPYHAPDGGPILRLASSVAAKKLAVGLDGGDGQLFAPFEKDRFKPQLPGRFVLPDSPKNNKRLHAKVFELKAADKVLVMTGSVNATAQSFESGKNVELSLARWLPASPFKWKEAEPAGYEPTQDATDFASRPTLYVDAWLDKDRTLHGRLTARGAVPTRATLVISCRDDVVYEAQTDVTDGSFDSGPVPNFDNSQASLLTAKAGEVEASCWLNVHEELEIAAEERESRAALSRVIRGEFEAEDLSELFRLLTLSTTAQGSGYFRASSKRAADPSKDEPDIEFNFMRWEASGQRQWSGNTLLGRNPYEILKAINRWMNQDLTSPAPSELAVAASKGLKPGLELKQRADDEPDDDAPSANPYELLDKLCQAIPVALERRPELQHGAVLAEVVASRAVQRALTADEPLKLKMAPCAAWLDRFSRFTYPEKGQEELCKVAAAMACLTAHRRERLGQDPQLSLLREAVERLAGASLSITRWEELAKAGIGRDLFRRVAEADREAVLAMHSRLAAAATLDDSLLSLLHKAANGARHTLSNEPEAALFPEAAVALKERRRRKADLLRGMMSKKALEHRGCPFCYHELSTDQMMTLRLKHVLVHKGLNCNQLLFYSDQSSRLEQGLKELPDA